MPHRARGRRRPGPPGDVKGSSDAPGDRDGGRGLTSTAADLGENGRRIRAAHEHFIEVGIGPPAIAPPGSLHREMKSGVAGRGRPPAVPSGGDAPIMADRRARIGRAGRRRGRSALSKSRDAGRLSRLRSLACFPASLSPVARWFRGHPGLRIHPDQIVPSPRRRKPGRPRPPFLAPSPSPTALSCGSNRSSPFHSFGREIVRHFNILTRARPHSPGARPRSLGARPHSLGARSHSLGDRTQSLGARPHSVGGTSATSRRSPFLRRFGTILSIRCGKLTRATLFAGPRSARTAPFGNPAPRAATAPSRRSQPRRSSAAAALSASSGSMIPLQSDPSRKPRPLG